MTRRRLATDLALGVTLVVAGIAISGFVLPRDGDRTKESLAADLADTGDYTCGMHPQVVQQGPGKCPLCGMELTPTGADSASLDGPGKAGVRVSRNFLQNFAVRTTVVNRADLPMQVRTIGYLDQDESKLVSVNTKFSGWIEGSAVNTVGERVSRGDILFEIYSPELVTAQEEYLSAIDYAGRLRQAGAHSGAVSRAESLVEAVTERLHHWGLTSQQVTHLRASRTASRTVAIYSPASGYVVEKLQDSLEGLRVVPGTTILKIADHSTLWVKVEFYEHHLRDLRPGLRADIALDAFPGRRWHGRLLFFEPAMNSQTQTLTGYVEVENADGRLRPKMYASVEVQLPGARAALTVPVQSVLRSGNSRNIVIVEAGNGLFVPREVALGIESEGRVQVVDGLVAGERVVASSQFLLDSESNLQAAVERLAANPAAGGHPHNH